MIVFYTITVDAALPATPVRAGRRPRRIAQGHVFGRPSRIDVTLDGEVPVVAGRAAISATGTLWLP